MHTPKLIVVATFFVVLVHLAFAARECSEDESATSTLIVFNSDCEDSCVSLADICLGYECICFVQSEERCLVRVHETQRKLLLTCSVLAHLPNGHFAGLERFERASDATQEITNELESELAKAVDDDNGSPGAPGLAVEMVSKSRSFDSSAEVLDVGSVNTDAEASFQSIEKTIEADVDRAGSIS